MSLQDKIDEVEPTHAGKVHSERLINGSWLVVHDDGQGNVERIAFTNLRDRHDWENATFGMPRVMQQQQQPYHQQQPPLGYEPATPTRVIPQQPPLAEVPPMPQPAAPGRLASIMGGRRRLGVGG